MFTFFRSIILLSVLLPSFAASKQNQADPIPYFPSYDITTAIPGHGYYQAPQQLNPHNIATPKWDGYCPTCTLPDSQLCKKLACAKNVIYSHAAYRGIQVSDDLWIRLANKVALEAVKHGGGPFGAVIVQIDDNTGKVLRYWIGYDHAANEHDPTAHAEMSVLRQAAKQLAVDNLGKISQEQAKLPQPGTFSHCVLYSSTEPCAMCLAAIYWAGIKEIIFSTTRYDAAAPGVNFSDKLIYEDSSKPYPDRRVITIRQAIAPNSLDAFNYYKRRGEVKHYGTID